MATDATGAATSLGIPKIDPDVDAPSGLGTNAAMDAINTLLQTRTGNLALTSATSTITLGGDTNIYRTAATVLKTDGSFRVGQFLDVDFASTGGQLRFGSAVDTNLYRSGAGILKTDGQFRTANEILGPIGPSNESGVRLGGDANLYRNGAAVLKTNGSLEILADLYVNENNTGKVYFGSLNDTNLYRSAVGVLKTDSTFIAGGTIGGIEITGGSGLYMSGGGFVRFVPRAANAPGTLHDGNLQLVTNGGGKSELRVYWNGGSNTLIATEP